ncbi:MAG: type 4a pilus biogenesis protein PilO [Candidatus Omnitrophica bacterium]|nr:type 4a pilus biogenesis protein PilO [Candidatus Omnitrophota bacterium]
MRRNDVIARLTAARKKLILTCAAALAILLLDANLALKPQISRLSGVNSNLRKLRSDIINARRDITELEKYKAGPAGSPERSEDLLRKVISEEEIPVLIEEVSKMAEGAGVKILQIRSVKNEQNKPAATTLLSKFFDIKIIISARSGFHELGKFINKIELFPVFMAVDGISIVHRGSGYPDHDIDMVLLAYFIGK